MTQFNAAAQVGPGLGRPGGWELHWVDSVTTNGAALWGAALGHGGFQKLEPAGMASPFLIQIHKVQSSVRHLCSSPHATLALFFMFVLMTPGL